MNIYVKQVMKLFNVSYDVAEEILGMVDVKFSNCSQREFNQSAKIAYSIYQMVNGKTVTEIQTLLTDLVNQK